MMKCQLFLYLSKKKKKKHLILKAGYLFYCVKNAIYLKGDCNLTSLLMLGTLAVAALDEPCLLCGVPVYGGDDQPLCSSYLYNTLPSAQSYQSHICTLLKFLGGAQRFSEGITLIHISIGEYYIVRQ